MKKLLVGALLVLVFLAYSLPPYLTGGSRVPLDDQPNWYYGLLVGHILLGSVAMLAGLVQLGRRWFAKYHWIAGRIYVACALPVGLAAIAIGTVTPFGPVNAASNVTLGSLMLLFTALGVRAIVGGDVAAHRRWMLRSAALMYSVIINRILGPIIFLVLDAAGAPSSMTDAVGPALVAWPSWLIAIGFCEWWLRRTPPKRRRVAGTPARNGEDPLRPGSERVSLGGGGGI
ncbi:DUF2306 domain-containing protein [Tsukamurella sp. M9C]|uniref:DUF2306 domain-containing protein n=1 Tax=Tsukamurella sp. M9C TaxID=2877520 RepID=UPI001CCABDAC|nr:DUF2306 domain-containing protein [Tsukamurella sp. M9C]MCA0157209.1 DUF2306 domain-containing protein [Tsukamurella sp. M9C]